MANQFVCNTGIDFRVMISYSHIMGRLSMHMLIFEVCTIDSAALLIIAHLPDCIHVGGEHTVVRKASSHELVRSSFHTVLFML